MGLICSLPLKSSFNQKPSLKASSVETSVLAKVSDNSTGLLLHLSTFRAALASSPTLVNNSVNMNDNDNHTNNTNSNNRLGFSGISAGRLRDLVPVRVRG